MLARRLGDRIGAQKGAKLSTVRDTNCTSAGKRAKTWVIRDLMIDVSTMSNTDNKHHETLIFDATNDAVVANAVTP